MTREKLRSIADEIESLRKQAAKIKTEDLTTLAESLGRKRRPGGKHLMYVNPLPGGRTVSITGHPGRPIGKGLALKILNQLEGDIDAWEQQLDAQEAGKTKKGGGDQND